MKKTLYLIVFFNLFYIVNYAQDYPFVDKNLHKMEDAELEQYKVTFSQDTPLFDEKGNTVKPEQVNDILKSGNFIPVIFGDTNHTAQAIVFRAATKKEKEEFKQWQAQQNPNANFKPGKIAPEFETTNIKGEKIKLSNLKGKIVVINFWFTNCPPCVQEIPELNKIATKYKKSGVEFLAITFDSKEKITPFVKEHPFYFNIISDMDIIRKYQNSNYPTTLIIDKDGKIMYQKTGIYTKVLDKTIEMFVAE